MFSAEAKHPKGNNFGQACPLPDVSTALDMTEKGRSTLTEDIVLIGD
jgi:hypothetical protein